MSLRSFHIIFIVCYIIVTIGFGYWAINGFQQEQSLTYLWTAIGAFITTLGLIIYEIVFLKKVKA